MGYFSSAESDLLYDLPPFGFLEISVFQSPESCFTGLRISCPPGRVCESVECARPVLWWAVVEVPGLASGLSLCYAEYVV